ncbi:hypothetical protein IC235_08260 [Hymenobacter sp. BT664]|uniref:Uncharacterized protein n=1 Tax=Hymenobacter montanus TaxID=2771359 RepID=A0A927BBT6_9BACT|nr:hypothetical protein [Hymenobacter montanus]MBD2767885.1 hypothetical protein [Hymenobacter montanus]
MQNVDNPLNPGSLEVSHSADCYEETEQVVIFELVVPRAAKVPAPHQHVEVAKWLIQATSVTSTVPGEVLTQLRVNNTALGSAWCMTATLAPPQGAHQLPLY